MDKFVSVFEKCGNVVLPEFSATRVMMMPLVLGDINSVPVSLSHYAGSIEALFDAQDYDGEVGYLTIDEKIVMPSETHRRSGKHVDGVYRGASGSWGGGGGWGGGGPSRLVMREGGSGFGTGMLTVSSHAQCRAWRQEFVGRPGPEGECDHLADQCNDEFSELFEAGAVYWADPLCVHESTPVEKTMRRQFVRISLPSEAPWFDGYTENPLGIKPTGEILGRRNDFMPTESGSAIH